MFIEVVIEGMIERRVQVDLAPFNHYTNGEFKVREQLINAYIRELEMLYPKAYFQLAFESKMNFFEAEENE